MAYLITETATMQCDKGAAPARLCVTSQEFVCVNGKRLATEQDYRAIENIPAFGVCSVTQKACMPATLPWNEPRLKDTINGLKKLTDASTCKCTLGGTVRFLDCGHERFVSAEDA